MTECQLKKSIIDFRNSIIDKCLREVGSINDKYLNFPREDWDSSHRDLERVLYEVEENMKKLKDT